MESAAGVVAKAFSNCMTDRYVSQATRLAALFHLHEITLSRTSPADQSRKWGIYYVVGLVLKCYFRVSLCYIAPCQVFDTV